MKTHSSHRQIPAAAAQYMRSIPESPLTVLTTPQAPATLSQLKQYIYTQPSTVNTKYVQGVHVT